MPDQGGWSRQQGPKQRFFEKQFVQICTNTNYLEICNLYKNQLLEIPCLPLVHVGPNKVKGTSASKEDFAAFDTNGRKLSLEQTFSYLIQVSDGDI